jgi:predicted metalloprotease
MATLAKLDHPVKLQLKADKTPAGPGGQRMVKWQGRRQSSNIEDRRGQGGGFGGGGLRGGLGSNPFGQGGGYRLPSGRGGMSLGSLGVVVIFIVIAMAFGVNPMSILTGESTTSNNSAVLPPTGNASEDELRQFVGVMVADTEDYWTTYFQRQGQSYTPPKVVLYTSQTESGCGLADASSGPFYCPNDRKVYLDLGFYRQLRDQFGAPGDFAQAYVIAHEVGHHIQNLTGVLPDFNQRRQAMSQEEANAYSVRVELQADCYAGVWGRGEFEQGYLDNADVQEAINAAQQIGDDRLTGGRVPPTQYTHGTSEQRQRWFQAGYESGDPAACDTFSGGI